MTIIRKKALIGKIKQLIDLNGYKTNFDLTFKVVSKDNTPFEAIVASQATLDSGSELQYKKVNTGTITGNIIADKGVYQNYFLVLRSENPTEHEIEIDIKDIPINPQIIEFQKNAREQEQKREQKREQEEKEKEKYVKSMTSIKPSKSINWNSIIIGIIVVVVIIGIYYYYTKKSSIEDMSNVIPKVSELPPLVFETNESIINNPIVGLPPIAPATVNIQSSLNENLLSRLNNIKIW
jgi:hypothetical protein